MLRELFPEFTDLQFLRATAIGLVGLVAWFLSTWRDPKDDRLSGTLRAALVSHSTSIAVGVLAYLVTAIFSHAAGQWNELAAFGAGYTGQSLLVKWVGPRNGHPPGGSPPPATT